ncbi:hypothetical protein [Saccharothrix xinjiangensis]|uniref:Uncharacterized protein n=1 Tax=Saccharothrix xinjiangensis TaxID=204798 RepID=A0ABV9Y897_9PSEU
MESPARPKSLRRSPFGRVMMTRTWTRDRRPHPEPVATALLRATRATALPAPARSGGARPRAT